jgi:predicted phage gp36 major capsid-like protein
MNPATDKDEDKTARASEQVALSPHDAEKAKNEKKSGGNAAEKEAAKLEEAVRVLTEKKDELENELAVVSTSGDASQLVRLNKTYTKLVADLAEAESKLEALILTL